MKTCARCERNPCEKRGFGAAAFLQCPIPLSFERIGMAAAKKRLDLTVQKLREEKDKPRT